MYYIEDSASLEADAVPVHSAGDVLFFQRRSNRAFSPVLEIA